MNNMKFKHMLTLFSCLFLHWFKENRTGLYHIFTFELEYKKKKNLFWLQSLHFIFIQWIYTFISFNFCWKSILWGRQSFKARHTIHFNEKTRQIWRKIKSILINQILHTSFVNEAMVLIDWENELGFQIRWDCRFWALCL